MKKVWTNLIKIIVVGFILVGLLCLGAEPMGEIQIIGAVLVAIGFFLGWCFKPIIEENDDEIYDGDLF